MNLKDKIADYPNFPKKGILFRDFSPILGDPSALSFMIEEFSKKFHPNDVDVFAGIESRGFIIACALAQKYNKGMILVRKAGKLPGKVVKTLNDDAVNFIRLSALSYVDNWKRFKSDLRELDT